jgi:hypothetical protein
MMLGSLKFYRLNWTEEFQAHVIRQPDSTGEDIVASGG